MLGGLTSVLDNSREGPAAGRTQRRGDSAGAGSAYGPRDLPVGVLRKLSDLFRQQGKMPVPEYQLRPSDTTAPIGNGGGRGGTDWISTPAAASATAGAVGGAGSGGSAAAASVGEAMPAAGQYPKERASSRGSFSEIKVTCFQAFEFAD